jgi:hypothetical protein
MEGNAPLERFSEKRPRAAVGWLEDARGQSVRKAKPGLPAQAICGATAACNATLPIECGLQLYVFPNFGLRRRLVGAQWKNLR